jgi:hypothetical protein
MAWVLSQNIEATLNGVNPRHNIIHKQIAQKLGLVDDPILNSIGEPTRVVTHIIDTQIYDGIQEFQ